MVSEAPEVETAVEALRAPFPWFGGKRLVAPLVWERFGNVQTYNEPFAGSLAVLLGRPHPPKVETVNDLDCYLANFWRALQHDPDGVAYYADGPVNEADLHARHKWLVETAAARAQLVMADPEYFDVRIAGWWVWGQCLWIGSGWCQRPEWSGRVNVGRAARGVNADRVRDRNARGTVHQRRRPHLSGQQGIERSALTRSGENPVGQRRRPILTERCSGSGVHRRWQGGGQGGGSGVHAPRLTQQLPALVGDAGRADRGLQAERFRGMTSSEGLYDYLRELAARLRRVRVCCGDWRRVLTPSVTTYIGTCGVFLDPPYSHELRERCYAEDHNISADVRAWALEHGDDPKMRIALCGYEGEHDMPDTWECVPWKAHGGYARTDRGRSNRERERIWFSPHCLSPEKEFPLFASEAV